MGSAWAYPVILIMLFAIFVTFKINGSSTGIYHKNLFGNTTEDPGAVFGSPKSIRSDEYVTTTSWIALQAQTDFASFNKNINSGRELVINPDVPIKDWVAVFRPHTWAYFIAPFEYAFSFSWWFGLVLLMISSYFFVYRILQKKNLAILLSLAFSISPFILWWYKSGLLLAISYFFIAAIILIRILNNEKVKHIKSQLASDIIYTICLAYIGTSFGLLLYAPFLIPISLVLFIFIIGYILDGLNAGKVQLKRIKTTILCISGSLLVLAIMGIVFYQDRQALIQAISGSVYPGERKISSGQLPFPPIYRFFDSFLMPLLPRPPSGQFYTNQSEASNFILLVPFLLIPGLILQAYDYVRHKKIYWPLLLIQLLSILFIARIAIPIGDGFFKFLLLDRVPNNRLIIGLGLAGFLQLIYLIKFMQKLKINKKFISILAVTTSIAVLILLIFFAKYVFDDFLVFRHSGTLILGVLSAFFTLIIFSFLIKKELLGAILLLLFTVFSSYNILPIQKGLDFHENSTIVNRIKETSLPSDSWVVVDNFAFETLPMIAGRKLISGPQPYTDLSFWRQIDTTGKYEDIYNRQAHAIFVSNTAEPNVFLPKDFSRIKNDLELEKGNVFKVRFFCDQFLYENIDMALSTNELDFPCLQKIDKISYPNADFFIYKIKPTI